MMRALALISSTGLCACDPSGPSSVLLDYQGAQVEALSEDLLSVRVQMSGTDSEADVQTYADCIAAQQTLDAGYRFARYIRKKTEQEAGIWRGDAVYTLSRDLPRGPSTIDAEIMVTGCVEAGIPTA